MVKRMNENFAGFRGHGDVVGGLTVVSSLSKAFREKKYHNHRVRVLTLVATWWSLLAPPTESVCLCLSATSVRQSMRPGG